MMSFLSKIFNVRLFDGHVYLVLFGAKIRIKYNQKYVEPTVNASGITEEKRQTPIVASFTSFPERINCAYITAKSLLNQDLKPDYVVLYLADEQFKNKEKDLPEKLLNLKQFGLEIRWCSDIRSYKKLIPALKDFPNAIIVTFDDDIIYKSNTISSLYNDYLKYPDCIIAFRAARLKIKNNIVLNETKTKNYYLPSFLNRLTGCGGVLYPPNSFYKDVLNKDIFYNLIPTHDDVWFWAMGVLNDKKVKVSKDYKESVTQIKNSQNAGLCKINNSKKGISTTMAYKLVIDKYPQILEKLKLEDN